MALVNITIQLINGDPKKISTAMLTQMSTAELVLLKELWRSKYGLHIENNYEERGSMNNRTKGYYSCEFVKRIFKSVQGRKPFQGRICFKTFDTYREALIFCLKEADYCNTEFDTEF